LRFSLADDIAALVARKGSIAVDGVSLTVSAVSEPGAAKAWFEVSLIPETLEATTLGSRRAGDLVNIETDILARQVQRMLLLGDEDLQPTSSVSAPHQQHIGFSAVPANSSTTSTTERTQS
jgi:riboflavin synthase